MIQHLLMVVALIFASTLFFYADQAAEWVSPTPPPSSSKTKVARVHSLKGKAYVTRESIEDLKLKDLIYAGDRVSTQVPLQLKMQSGHKIEVGPDSEVALHVWMDKYVVYRYSGTVQLLNSQGAVDQLVLADDNTAQFIEENVVEKEAETKSKNLSRGLTNTQIKESIRRIHPQLQRCYLNLVKAGTAQPGRVVMNIQILPKGRIEKAMVSSSTLENEDFKNCLLTVIKRARFPAFQGRTIVANYPMNFK